MISEDDSEPAVAARDHACGHEKGVVLGMVLTLQLYLKPCSLQAPKRIPLKKQGLI